MPFYIMHAEVCEVRVSKSHAEATTEKPAKPQYKLQHLSVQIAPLIKTS